MINNEEKIKQAQKIAREILVLSRNTLLVNFRFLDAALYQLQLREENIGGVAVTGEELIYDFRRVISAYAKEKQTVTRMYMHVLLHCIFKHMFFCEKMNSTYWDLACDIAVENIINDLDCDFLRTSKAYKQQQYIDSVKGKVKLVTAEKIYHYFTETPPSETELEKLRELFYCDFHDHWYLPSEGADGDDGENSDDGQVQKGAGYGNGSVTFKVSSAVAERWSDISQSIQVDMETFSKEKGDKAGSMLQELKAVNREKFDYVDFLRRFAVLGEAMQINDDEFDYVFYTYGLKLYDNIPLIEPLEYKEVKRIKEFVIAIDTSGSTRGDTVQAFLNKTYNILKQQESFFTKINLHIIQCDAEIQQDVKITCQEDFDEYMKNLKILGLGGTDFRPIFSYVDKLISEKELTNLKGMIYFTDGFGDFPSKQPEYDTAFVFIDDEYNNYNVPVWAMKLVLQREEI